MFSATVDAREIDLINKVAKALCPSAWDDRPVMKEEDGKYVIDDVSTTMALKINDSNRSIARETAAQIIAIVREHK